MNIFLKFKPAAFLFLIFLFGCYEQKVQEAASHLTVGMTKAKLDEVFKGITFLKEQEVSLFPETSEEEMRGLLVHEKHYDELYPKDLINLLSFDGSVKVFSYLIRQTSEWPNGKNTAYVAVFYSESKDHVLGWARMSTMTDPSAWRDRF